MNKHTLPPEDFELLTKTPALRAYLNRIGATVKSFRKFIVEADGEPTYGSMRGVIATIVVKKSTIECSSAKHAPIEAELSAIEAELVTVNWPKSITATRANVNELEAQIGGRPTLFKFGVIDGNGFVFVQQRITSSGKKCDLPWSYWSDGVWRRMEPDGLLPLFGLDQIKKWQADYGSRRSKGSGLSTMPVQ